MDVSCETLICVFSLGSTQRKNLKECARQERPQVPASAPPESSQCQTRVQGSTRREVCAAVRPSIRVAIFVLRLWVLARACAVLPWPRNPARAADCALVFAGDLLCVGQEGSPSFQGIDVSAVILQRSTKIKKCAQHDQTLPLRFWCQ